MADAWAVPFGLAVLLGVAAATLVGLVVALPTLRVRGVNLAVVTLALAISNLVLLNADYTGGPIRGTVVRRRRCSASDSTRPSIRAGTRCCCRWSSRRRRPSEPPPSS